MCRDRFGVPESFEAAGLAWAAANRVADVEKHAAAAVDGDVDIDVAAMEEVVVDDGIAWTELSTR